MSSNNPSQIALHLAIKEENYKDTEKLLDEYGLNTDDKWMDFEMMIDAVKTENTDIVKLLLKYACRVNKGKTQVYSPLHCAIEKNCVEIVKILLEHNANPNAKWKGLSPLHVAINTKSVEVVKLLLEYKADVCAKDDEGATPIHRAYDYKNGTRAEILDLMLKAHNGKLENTIDNRGISIFHVACTRNLPDMVDNFLQRKINVHSRAKVSNEKIWSGFTGLHFAAMYYQIDVIRVLLKYGADVNAMSYYGLIPLWMAITYRFSDEIARKLQKNVYSKFPVDLIRKLSESELNEVMEFMSKELRNIETVQLLLDKKSNVNIRSKNGMPLFFQAYSPQLTMNFSDEIINKITFETASEIFMTEGRKKIMRMLINHGICVNVIFPISIGKQEGIPCGEKGVLLHYIANNNNNNTIVPGWKKIVKMILENGGDPNVIACCTGDTPMHKAAKIGFYKMINLLLKYKANPNCTDNNLCTPLHYAKGKKTIQALVDGGADVNAKDKEGRTPALKVEGSDKKKDGPQRIIISYH